MPYVLSTASGVTKDDAVSPFNRGSNLLSFPAEATGHTVWTDSLPWE
jgi:hypothetical protein